MRERVTGGGSGGGCKPGRFVFTVEVTVYQLAGLFFVGTATVARFRSPNANFSATHFKDQIFFIANHKITLKR
jgi:hypothetical protein